MKMRSDCTGMTATSLRTIGSNRLFSAVLLEDRPRRIPARPLARTSLRLPVSPENRDRLKCARQSEQEAWEAPAAQPAKAAALVPRIPRLPAPERDTRENWLYALLTVLCLLVLGSEFLTLFRSAGNWSQFVEFVRQLLA